MLMHSEKPPTNQPEKTDPLTPGELFTRLGRQATLQECLKHNKQPGDVRRDIQPNTLQGANVAWQRVGAVILVVQPRTSNRSETIGI
ncbi:MAG: hypothetical protein ABI220_03140 [Candidatus Saccharimonadales bacterium]